MNIYASPEALWACAAAVAGVAVATRYRLSIVLRVRVTRRG